MLHKSYISNLTIITLLLCILNISCLDILDISDFTFYYKTYYYMIDSSQSDTITYYNNEFQINISINISSNIITLTPNNINNIIELNALTDSNWDEISNIHLIQSKNNNRISSSRSLLSACPGSYRSGMRFSSHSCQCMCMMHRLRKMRRRKRARLARIKGIQQRMRMHAKWRQRLRRIRRRKDTKLKIALRHLKRKEETAGDEFGWIADALQRKLKYRRRIMNVNAYDNIISLCKIIKDNIYNYEICLYYYVGQYMFLGFEIKFGDRKVLKTGNNTVNYRNMIPIYESFNPIAMDGYLGYMIYKYESMNWHGFEFNSKGIMNELYEYGEFDGLNGLIEYFDEYGLDINGNNNGNNGIECGMIMDGLSVEMCMKIVKGNDIVDVLLYFEKDGDGLVDISGGFKDVYWFNNDDDWDEIDKIYLEGDESWFKKCSNKLMIGKICVEQYDEEYYRASIKFKSMDEKRDEH
eukprot:151808_1